MRARLPSQQRPLSHCRSSERCWRRGAGLLISTDGDVPLCASAFPCSRNSSDERQNARAFPFHYSLYLFVYFDAIFASSRTSVAVIASRDDVFFPGRITFGNRGGFRIIGHGEFRAGRRLLGFKNHNRNKVKRDQAWTQSKFPR